MCIAALILNLSSRFPVVVIHSREEDTARPTSVLQLDEQGILGARDLQSGGVAAVGTNVNTGVFCALTNSRYSNIMGSEGVSRGVLVSNILSQSDFRSIRSVIESPVKYNGGFHLICGSFGTGEVYYASNVGGDSSVTDIFPKDFTFHVNVVCNEHPESEYDWLAKKNYIKSKLVTSFPDPVCSWQEIVCVIDNIFSEQKFRTIHSTDESLRRWTPFPPTVERHVLEHIVVPAISVDGNALFGTVSQTIMIFEHSEDGKQFVHYLYRTVRTERGNVTFTEWGERHLPLLATKT